MICAHVTAYLSNYISGVKLANPLPWPCIYLFILEHKDSFSPSNSDFSSSFSILTAEEVSGFITVPHKNTVKAYPPSNFPQLSTLQNGGGKFRSASFAYISLSFLEWHP